jgi:hypothetical protein
MCCEALMAIGRQQWAVLKVASNLARLLLRIPLGKVWGVDKGV